MKHDISKHYSWFSLHDGSWEWILNVQYEWVLWQSKRIWFWVSWPSVNLLTSITDEWRGIQTDQHLKSKHKGNWNPKLWKDIRDSFWYPIIKNKQNGSPIEVEILFWWIIRKGNLKIFGLKALKTLKETMNRCN